VPMRWLVDIDARSPGRAPFAVTRTVEADELERALELALADVESPRWVDSELSSISLRFDRIAEEQPP
jgi:hypothetical protein